MIATGFLCVFVTFITLSQCNFPANNDFKSKNDSMASKRANNTEKPSKNPITELFDSQKKILAHKNEITGECSLKLVNDNTDLKNKFDSSMELSEDEMIEIIGENIQIFCKDKVIIFNDFDGIPLGRSKRSTDRKRYKGQTQTQFISFGAKNPVQETKSGLAEALAQPDLSRATVSGLNGMGQAQSQSSFSDCDECQEKDYRALPVYTDNSPNQNLRPYGGSNTNTQFPNSQYQGSNPEPFINGQYPSIYPETNSKVPGKQDQRFVVGSPDNGKYPGTLNGEVPSRQDQVYGGAIPINGQYPAINPGSGTNNRIPSKQDQGLGIGSPINGNYPAMFNGEVPSRQDQVYGSAIPINGQYPAINPGSGTNNRIPSKQDQGSGIGFPTNGQHLGTGINGGVPSKQDQVYGSAIPINGQYPAINPGSGTNIKNPADQSNQGDKSSSNIHNPNLHLNLENNNKLPGKFDQEFGHRLANGQNPNLMNPNSPESKIPGNADTVNQNIYPVGSGPFNPSGWNLQNKVNNYPNNQQTYPGGSGFPSFPSGSSQGILAPHNSPQNNADWTNPLNPVVTEMEYHNRPSNYPSGQSTNSQNQMPSGQITPFNPILSTLNSQNERNVNNEVNKMQPLQRGYEIGSNTHGNQGYTQLNLPSLCNFLYQTCLNALSNNKMANEHTNIHTTTGLQNAATPQLGMNINQMIPSYRQPQGSLSTGGSSVQQPGYSPADRNLYPNQIQPIYGPPQGPLSTGVFGVQQPGYTTTGGNVNPSQLHPQSSLGTGVSDVQYGYAPFTGNQNPNQIQPNYGQPQNSLGTGGSSVQQSKYTPTGGNVYPNQVQPSYGQPQGSLNARGTGVQQPGYFTPGGNVNPSQMYPQGSFGTTGSGLQQPGYAPSSGNVYPNQVQPSYGQPQGSLIARGNDVQQPGNIQPGGSINPNQMHPQGSFGTTGSGLQQPGYAPSGGNVYPNQIQPSYGQPQGSLNARGTDVQQPGNVSPGGSVNPNQMHPQGSFGTTGSGLQQPGYAPSGGNVYPNQVQPSYGQPQGSSDVGGAGVQQPGYITSDGKVNPSQMQPQGSFGTTGSGLQQSGFAPSGGNVYPNQVQPSYGQPQGSSDVGGAGVQQPGYITSDGKVNPGQMRPQGSFNTGGSGVQQPGFDPSSGNNVFPNRIQPQNSLGGAGWPGTRPTGVPGTQPQSYDGNFNGGPGSSNPIIGGQFGTDISSGGSVVPVDTEGGDTQSMTSVNVDGKETSASASAQGKSKSGTTQTQVSGSYAGTGTFSAQAQTSDSDKGAQSQIVSNTNGTTSTAQGRGGGGQAQSQVLYNAESGVAMGESQSSGINYGTNAQLQAGIKGGVADAQSTGPGSTSSQAQIGFLPYESAANGTDDQKSLFKGGGAASSQGGSYSGQSQSQLFGSYKYGISYNGAAQASSGRKLQNLPKLNLTDARSKAGHLERSDDDEAKAQLQPQQQIVPNRLRSQSPTNSMLNAADRGEQNRKRLPTEPLGTTTTQATPVPPLPVSPAQEPSRNFEVDSEYEANAGGGDGDDDDEYEDDKDTDDDVNTKSAAPAAKKDDDEPPEQEQSIVLNLDGKHDARITHDSDGQLKSGQVLDAGQEIPGTNGTKIPSGFRGRVASVAGDHTEARAVPGGQAQTQTVLLTPGAGGLTVVDKTKLRALLGAKDETYVRPYDSYRSKANGETGKFEPGDKNIQYFTKSSTCGYFSFSCNYVDGAKRGAKICKPNPPPFPCQKNSK